MKNGKSTRKSNRGYKAFLSFMVLPALCAAYSGWAAPQAPEEISKIAESNSRQPEWTSAPVLGVSAFESKMSIESRVVEPSGGPGLSSAPRPAVLREAGGISRRTGETSIKQPKTGVSVNSATVGPRKLRISKPHIVEYRLRVNLAGDEDVRAAMAARLRDPQAGSHLYDVTPDVLRQLDAAGIKTNVVGGVTEFRVEPAGERVLSDESAQATAQDSIALTPANYDSGEEPFNDTRELTRTAAGTGVIELYSGTINMYIEDNTGYAQYYRMRNEIAPPGSWVTNLEYRTRIDDEGDGNFYCGDYELWLFSGDAAWETCIYANLGGATDGGYDDDVDDDADIYLNWRNTHYFDGETPNQWWGIICYDNWSGDDGEMNYIELKVHWQSPSEQHDFAAIDCYPASPDDVWTPLTTVTEGQVIKYCFKFSYSGPGATATVREQLDNDTPIEGSTNFSTGEWTLSSPDWTATAGNHRVRGWCDVYNGVTETDENNNNRDENPCFYVTPGHDFAAIDCYPASPDDVWTPLTTVAEGQVIKYCFKFSYTGTGATATTRIQLDSDPSGEMPYDFSNGQYVLSSPDWTATVGSHRVQGWCDFYNDVAETDENNNNCDENPCFEVGFCPDLTPYQLSHWNDTIPIGITQLPWDEDHTYDGPFNDTQTLYFNWCSLNRGNETASNYTVHFEVSGTGGGSWDWPNLTSEPGSGVVLTNDQAVGPLSLGPHTFKVWVDYNNNVANECDETNNYYERTIDVEETGEIHGCKWNDLNGDGVWDGDEPGLENWKIYLDENGNGQWDNGEPYELTGADGSYSFTGLVAGTYVIGEVLQDGWIQTYPGGSARAAVQAGTTTYGDLLTPEDLAKIVRMDMNSPPTPPVGVERTVVRSIPASVVMLNNVPTSIWTYGCSATSAGMIFGYYDRTGYPNMYTGPANGGVAPLTDLGQGIETPIPGSCSIIATQDGFDGRTVRGHVDDYWTGYLDPGPDPWEGHWDEHAWADCTADYMGTNQWKWDFEPWPNGDGNRDNNVDGATSLFTYGSADKLHDFVPPANCGLPQTELCHGMRLFAESRGYTVLENYTQNIDPCYPGGFSFADYMAEIDAGRPVMIHVIGHSMVGVGYEAATQTVYIHNTWDNSVHNMTWGESYSGMNHAAVTVLHLAPIHEGSHTVVLNPGEVVSNINFGNQAVCTPPEITDHPDSQTVCVGDSVEFCVSATESSPLSYQWERDGIPIPEATDSCYLIESVKTSDTGANYTCVVSNSCGTAESNPATLTVVPCNDDFDDCEEISGSSGSVTGTNVNATSEPGEPDHAGGTGGNSKSVWYCWIAPRGGTATFDTNGSDFNTLLAVYTGPDVANLNEVASDDDSGEGQASLVSFCAIPGTTYHIAVDGYHGASGNIVLNWSQECFPCTYTTYNDWKTLGKPNCWCGIYGNPPCPYQCDGDADCSTQGIPKYRIYTNDFNILVANWKKIITDPTLNPCADFDHKPQGIPKYRVYTNDFNILVGNWKKTDAQLPDHCPRPE